MMIALGVPKRIARAFRNNGKLPRPTICKKLVYARRKTFYVVNANASTGERGSGLSDIAVVTTRPHLITKRILDRRLRRVPPTSNPPLPRAVFKGRGVRVTRYDDWVMVGDVVGVLASCTGIAAKTIQRGYTVFIIAAQLPAEKR
jgi:hypothetical protein